MYNELLQNKEEEEEERKEEKWLKIGKHSRYFTKETIPMANKYIKKKVLPIIED